MKAVNLITDDVKATNETPRIVESLRRSLDEKDVEIQRLLDENLSLNEKIKHLHREAIEHDKRLDELDQQHNEALQNLVLIKNELQENITALKTELDAVRVENEETKQKYQHLSQEHDELVAANEEALGKFNEIKESAEEKDDELAQLKTQVEELQTQLHGKVTEIAELNAMIEEKDAHSREGSDKFELIDIEKEKMTSSMEINRLQTELDEINERLSILCDLKDQYDSNVAKLSSVVSERNRLEQEVGKIRAENERLLKKVEATHEAVQKLQVS